MEREEAFKRAFHEACCAQQGIAVAEDCSLPHEQLRLLYENEWVWVVLDDASLDGPGLPQNVCVIRKTVGEGGREMEVVELA